MKTAIYGCKSIPEASAYVLLAPELARVRPSPTSIWYGGGPRGVDQAALEWSARAALPAVTQQVNWQKYDDQAGEVRGREVAAWCALAVIAWDPHAPEPDGTLNGLVREMLLLGKRVVMLITAPDHALDRRLDSAEIDKSFLLGALARPRIPRRRAA